MQIGIFLHPYGEKNPAGLARTIFELTNGLLEIDAKNNYFIFVKHKNSSAPNFPGKNWKFCAGDGERFWMDKLIKANPQLDACVFNTPVLPLFFRPKKSIVLALDFGYKYLPAKGLRDFLIRLVMGFYHGYSLRRADAIVAISGATQKDAIRYFGISEEKIKVVHCGFKKICEVLPKERADLPERFFLFAGIIKERKNVFNIVKAFGDFQKSNPAYSLLIAGHGAGTYFESIKKYIVANGFENKVLFFGHASDADLSFLYRKAYALVFPSIVEGFGFPVLEAMDCGLPVITSKTTSLGEIGNGAAILVDPLSVDEIKNAMADLAKNPELHRDLIEKGKDHSAQFSWQKAARGLLDVIESA